MLRLLKSSRVFFYQRLKIKRLPWADEERLQELEKNEIVQEMPAYPNDGSIKVLDDTVVIKLQKTEKES